MINPKKPNFSTIYLMKSLPYFVFALLFLTIMYIFRNDSKIQLEIVFISALVYVGFALIHHHFDKSLTLETIIEYILLAALVLILISGQVI